MLQLFCTHLPCLVALWLFERVLRLVTAEDLALVGTVSFGDVVIKAQAAGMLAIGWRPASTEGATAILSPTVSTMLDLAPADQIIVIA